MQKKSGNINSLGILGLGSIGKRHAKNCILKKIKVFGFDVCKSKLAEAKKIGVEIISKENIVDLTQTFIVCTPSDLHHEDLKFLLQKAKRILVEKPFTHNYILSEKLLKNNYITKVYTAFNLRFHSVVRKIKDILNERALGKILWSNSIVCSDLKAWRPGTDYKKNYTNNLIAGGVINDYSHEIDLINFFFGKNKNVSGFMRNSNSLGLRVNDYASIIMENRTGIFSSIVFDYCTGPSIRRGVIRGLKASLFYDLLNRKIKMVSDTGKILLKKNYSSNFDSDYKDELQAFIEKKRNVELASWKDGIEASRVIEKIYSNHGK